MSNLLPLTRVARTDLVLPDAAVSRTLRVFEVHSCRRLSSPSLYPETSARSHIAVFTAALTNVFNAKCHVRQYMLAYLVHCGEQNIET